MKVCVVGMGYIGLPTALVLADAGHQVLGYDLNDVVVSEINKGNTRIIEKGISGLLKKVVKTGSLVASNTIDISDVYIICVPTPLSSDRKPDMSYVEAAVNSIAPLLKSGDLVILESTVPVGATANVCGRLQQLRSDIVFPSSPTKKADVYVAHCPERIIPGNMLHEICFNDRVIGGENEASTRKAGDLYKSFCKGKIIETDAKTAELTKLAENSFRDVNIAFANELSLLCDKCNVDVDNLISIANCHPRVNILRPGIGVGGHCIAIDPWFLKSGFPNETRLISAARDVNLHKTEWCKIKIIEAVKDFQHQLGKPPIVGCLGITYKPDVDDTRESPALSIVNYLKEMNIDILVCDPNVMLHENIELCDLNYVLEKSDIILRLVDHAEFQNISGHQIIISF